MNKELIIDSGTTEVVMALLEDKRLVELHRERKNNNYSVGDIYLGKIKKIISGLNAAFVDVGYEKDAFLHYLDLGSQVNSLNKYTKLAMAGKTKVLPMEHFHMESEIEKTGKITEVLHTNQPVLVQIAKEPISTKGPRITSDLSLAGRYLVLVPFSDRISVSQKIQNADEKSRLKRLVQSIKPKNFGVIIRTIAEGKMVADLDADLNNLVAKWYSIAEKLANAKPPRIIMGEINRSSAMLRDLLNESFNSIHVNDPSVFDELRDYIKTIAPDKIDILKLHRGKVPIFDHFGIEKQIKGSFGKVVSIKSGAYLVIEHTEALHVIDVNSGQRISSENSQEDNALDVNMEAAAEIARQLRLRDMGGIIVVDFIDMVQAGNRRTLYEKMKEEMKKDRAKHNVLPPSKFGLVQITRQRVRTETSVETLEKCPACGGSGKIRPSVILVDEIESNLRYLIREQMEPSLSLRAHPFIHAYLTKGLFSAQMKWFFKYKKWIKVYPSTSYHFLEYRFFNKLDDEIKL
ncbi:MAG: Rne/Rng family ribonuclease [Bacteroidia bacterium]|nr:MAG: Rne/Rng family ribonuclease [Bacteroidia bacterium]